MRVIFCSQFRIVPETRTAPVHGHPSGESEEPTETSLAGQPIDSLPQQIGVSIVARIFLDHVEQDPAQGAGRAVPRAPIRRLEVGTTSDEAIEDIAAPIAGFPPPPSQPNPGQLMRLMEFRIRIPPQGIDTHGSRSGADATTCENQ